MSRPIWLIVNPHSGGGRGMRRLPEAERALTALGLEHQAHCTTSLEHGRELAREGADRGALVVTLSRRRADRRGRRGPRRPAGRAARHPAGRARQRPRADARHPARRRRGGLRGAARRRRAAARPRLRGERPFVGIASLGFDSDANRIANEAPSWLGQGVYAYGALRALAAWRPARFDRRRSTATRRGRSTGYSVAAANNSGLRRRHVRWLPTRSSTTGCSTSSPCVRCPSAGSCAMLPQRLQGHARRTAARCRWCAPARSGSAPTARSSSTPTATRSARLPVTIARAPALRVLRRA